ncbi:MAG TPA: electron transfer flavoprotein subunit beta/FixA family protein, partial [Candidatus Coatesbacteria bacterium]|nr:electron transfer flavoprotein subunit beta/FixA family protein [Candidatus Coatesbacteria bacterium]
SMGPPQAEAVLRDAVAMGVDEAVLLSDPAFAGADTLATSYVLARAIARLGPEVGLVFAGKQAIDGDTGQVGPGISRRLGWTQLTYVARIGRPEEGVIEVERLLEDGREVLEARLPAVLSLVKGVNEPRLPSLRGLRRAKTVEIPVWNAETLGLSEEEVGLAGSPTQVIKVFTPAAQSAEGEKMQAPPREAAAIFVKWLEDNRLLRNG